MTKICDFIYRIYELTKILISYFIPVTAGRASLNIYEGCLLMVLSMMIIKKLFVKKTYPGQVKSAKTIPMQYHSSTKSHFLVEISIISHSITRLDSQFNSHSAKLIFDTPETSKFHPPCIKYYGN